MDAINDRFSGEITAVHTSKAMARKPLKLMT